MSPTVDSLFLSWRRDGDLGDLAQVYDLTATDLLRIAIHLTRDPATAEDLVQATFVAAIEGADRFDPSQSLRSWLAGILHNQAKWRLRSDSRSPDPTRLSSPEPRDPFDDAASAEFDAQVDQAIAELPEVYQPVLRLSLKHQLTAAEIAHSLNRPAGTVRSQITRGLELLRTRLPASAQTGTLGLAFAALMPRRGLAAIREQVLAYGAAKTAAATGTATAVLTGALLMKKILGIAVAAALLFFALSGPDLLQTVEPPIPEPPRATEAGLQLEADLRESEQSPTLDEAEVRRRQAITATTPPVWRLVGNVATTDATARGVRVRVSLACPYYTELLTDVPCAVDGSFEVDLSAVASLSQLDLDRAKVKVVARAIGHMEFDSVLDLPHHDPSRSLELRQDFRLDAAAVATGRVLDLAGAPVEGARVRFVSDSGNDFVSIFSDQDGRYRLTRNRSGAVEISAMHARLGTASMDCRLEVGEEVEVPDLTLSSSSTTCGRIVFENRQPVPGLRLRVGDRMTETDEDGRFTVASLSPGEHRLVLRDERNGPRRVVTTGAPEQEIVLAGMHLVRLRFADEAGHQLLPFRSSYRVYGREHDVALRQLQAGDVLQTDLETDDSGRGFVEQMLLATGSWLWVQTTHDRMCGDTLIHVDGSRNVVDATMRLTDRAPEAMLRVIARNAAGGSVGPIEARLQQIRLGDLGVEKLEAVDEGSEASRGEQWLYRVPAGEYRLRIGPSRSSRLDQENVFDPIEQTVLLTAGQETIVPIDIQSVGHVRFRFHATGLDAGDPVPGLRVASTSTEGQPRGWQSHFISKSGRGWSTGPAVASRWIGWRPRMSPGQHLLTVKSEGYLDERLSVFIEPGKTVDVDVWLRPR